jgi:hypothetical protein
MERYKEWNERTRRATTVLFISSLLTSLSAALDTEELVALIVPSLFLPFPSFTLLAMV